MLYIYWPYKSVPEWLEKITFKGTSDGKVPAFHHGGFGIVVKQDGLFKACMISGNFLCIYGAGMHVSLKGQGKGVRIYPSILQFLKSLIAG